MTWRLLVVPAACWLAAAVLAAESVTPAGVAAVGAASVALWAAWTRRGQTLVAWRTLLLVTMAAVCAVAVSAGARAHSLAAQPWPEWAEQRARVQVVLRLIHTPVQVATTPWADADATTLQTARAVTLSASRDGVSWSAAARVTVRVPGDVDDTRLRRGDQIHAAVRVSPGDWRDGLTARLDALEVSAIVPDASWTGRVDRAFRESLAGLSTDEASLVQGLTLGEDADLTPGTRQEIRAAGLGHLTAVSGANLAMVVGVAMWVARTLGARRSVALVPVVLSLGLYVGLVGPEPSVVRAAAMAIVALIGVLLGGGSGIAALASAVTVLLVWDPGLASSRGFALSCAATLGLIAAAPRGRRVLEQLRDRVPGLLVVPVAALAAAFVTAVAAAVATAPLLVGYGEGLSWAAIVANVLVAPVVPVVTIAGLAVGALSLVVLPLAEALAWLPGAGAWWIVVVAHWAAGIPGGRVALPGSWQSAVAVAAALGALAVLSRRWPRAPVLAAVAAVIAALGHATMPPALRGVPRDWAVAFCDVGQGDAAVLRSGAHSAVLVDAGPAPGAAVQCLRRLGVTRVDAVILSHFHLDHMAGFSQVAATFEPSELWVSPLADPQPQAAEVRAAAAAAGTNVLVPGPGHSTRWGAVHVQVLGPARLAQEGSAPNNASVVVVADVAADEGSLRVLLSGDVEPQAQAALMAAVSAPRVDVAKVPHHGSANQHPAFPRWADAAVAVVSCGEGNDYGHPSDLTLRSWQATGATTARTDLQGDVFVSVAEGGVPVTYVAKSVG